MAQRVESRYPVGSRSFSGALNAGTDAEAVQDERPANSASDEDVAMGRWKLLWWEMRPNSYGGGEGLEGGWAVSRSVGDVEGVVGDWNEACRCLLSLLSLPLRWTAYITHSAVVVVRRSVVKD